MARIRSIKPEFFLHEGMAELSPLHRLLFIGLWTLADKEGRIGDRPRRIKATLFPWDVCDVDALLWDLAEHEFIVRHETDGKDCIELPTFRTHQRPHPKETDSTLPGKNTASRVKKRQEIKVEPSIPSCPPGKESLESGKELLEAEVGKPKAPPPSPNQVSAPGAFQLPAEALKQLADRRAPDSPRVPIAPTPPTTEPSGWLGDDFWRWAQSKRWAAGIQPEKPPHPSELSSWWSSARMTAETHELQEAFLCFGDEEYWQRRKLPFAGFISQWQRFVPVRSAHAS